MVVALQQDEAQIANREPHRKPYSRPYLPVFAGDICQCIPITCPMKPMTYSNYITMFPHFSHYLQLIVAFTHHF